MRRPHHREKSHLFWKLLGTVGAVNLIAWPVLIHAGRVQDIGKPSIADPLRPVVAASAGSHPSVPSRVISPPAHSPTQASTAPTHARNRTAPRRLAEKAHPASADVHTAPPPAAPQHSRFAPTNVANQAQPAAPHPAPRPVQIARNEPAHTAVRPAPPQTRHETPSPPPKPVRENERSAVAARLARAKQLEAEGRLVAEQIEREREMRAAARSSPQPPVAQGSASAQGTMMTAGAGVSPITHSGAVSAPAPRPQVVPNVKAARPDDRPAVAVMRAYPTVPDRMMTSSWHATFRGQFTVRQDGTATPQMISSTGFPVLDRAAMAAARRWRFRPARRDGRPVAGSLPFAFNYDVHPTR